MATPTETPNTFTAAVSRSGVTWSAIIAGAFVAAAVSLVLLILGSGVGLASVSPWENAGVSAAGFGIGAAIWLVVVQFVASGLGGYLAGRLRSKWVGIQSNEVFFRDTAHGFLAWAVATVFTFAVLATAVSSIVSGATRATATVLSGIGQGASQAISDADPSNYFLDKLFRSDRAPVDGELPDVRAESVRILFLAIVDGELAPADKTYLTRLVSARTGLTQAEAESRIDEVIVEVKAAETKAKEAADSTRQAAALLSLITVIALLLGALVASAAAAWGGRHRDRSEVVVS